MPDDLKNTGRGDNERIYVHQAHEVEYWTRVLGVTEQKLKEIVERVGPMVKDVRKALGK